MYKKIIFLSIAAIILVCLTVGGTWAYISDAGQSSGNYLQAGTIDLGIRTSSGTYAQGANAFIYGEDFKPNFNIPRTDVATYYLSNFGNVAGSRMNVTFAVPSYSGGVGSHTLSDLEKALKIQQFVYNRVHFESLPINTFFVDTDSDGVITLWDVINGGVPTIAAGPLATGQYTGLQPNDPNNPDTALESEFDIQFQVKGTLDASYQSTSLTVEIQFTLTQ